MTNILISQFDRINKSAEKRSKHQNYGRTCSSRICNARPSHDPVNIRRTIFTIT